MNRGFWIWNISSCEKGDPLAIAAAASKAGLSDVFVKVADGAYPANIDPQTKKDLVPDVVNALRSLKIHVWGWHYVYGYPQQESSIAIQRIKQLNLDGYVIDAEGEFEKPNMASVASKLMVAITSASPDTHFALSSFRFPNLHSTFPWSSFLNYCQIIMPQVYWEQASNAGDQLQNCVDTYKGLSNLPIYPTGPTYKNGGWKPTIAQINEFETVAQKLGIPSVSYFSWDECRRDLPELWPVPSVTTPAPATPIGDRLDAIEQTLDQLTSTLNQATQSVQGIKDQLKQLGV